MNYIKMLLLFLISISLTGCMSTIFEQPTQPELINVKVFGFDRDSDGTEDEQAMLFKDEWKCFYGDKVPDMIDENQLYTCDDIIVKAVLVFLLENPSERTPEIERWVAERSKK